MFCQPLRYIARVIRFSLDELCQENPPITSCTSSLPMSRLAGSINAVYRTRDGLMRNWWVVDVRGQRVGRAASQIAALLIVLLLLLFSMSHTLQGKHKPTYNHHTDQGDYVIVINSQHVEFTGISFLSPLSHRVSLSSCPHFLR